MILREQIRIEIIKWLGSRYAVTPYMGTPSDKDIDQNKVEELVKTISGLFTPNESINEYQENPYINIIVNGEKKVLLSPRLSYKDIVSLAGHGRNPNVLYSITFSKPFNHWKEAGIIAPGEELLVSEGARISCYYTGAA